MSSPYWMQPNDASERTRLWSQTSSKARRVAVLCEAIAAHERGRGWGDRVTAEDVVRAVAAACRDDAMVAAIAAGVVGPEGS